MQNISVLAEKKIKLKKNNFGIKCKLALSLNKRPSVNEALTF
jgi:hypothetical protein